MSIREESDVLVPALAKALDGEPALVLQLLDQLENLFVAE